jgi:hypothetical protein
MNTLLRMAQIVPKRVVWYFHLMKRRIFMIDFYLLMKINVLMKTCGNSTQIL